MGLFDSAASVKFTNPGDTAEGTILEWSEVQQREFDRTTGKPSDKLATWDDGSPKMQLVFQLQTDLSDDEQDTGQRAVYVSSTRAIKAVVSAVRTAGGRLPEQGGRLKVTYTGNDPKSFNGSAKDFRAEYRRPEATSATFGTGGQQATTQTYAQDTRKPAPQNAAGTQQADSWADPLTTEQRTKFAQLDKMGIPDAVIASALGVDAATVARARGDEVI